MAPSTQSNGVASAASGEYDPLSQNLDGPARGAQPSDQLSGRQREAAENVVSILKHGGSGEGSGETSPGGDIESQGGQQRKAKRVVNRMRRGQTGQTWKFAAYAVALSHRMQTDHSHQEHDGPCDLCCCKAFSTHIRTILEDGQTVRWSARRHRRNRYQRDHANMLEEMQRFALASIKRYRDATSTPLKAVSFVVGPAFFIGSILFIVGSIGQTRRGWFEETWSDAKYNLWVNIPFVVGALLYYIGMYCSAVEVSNTGHESRMHEWRKNGKEGPKPHVNWSPVPTHIFNDFISYYGTWIQYIGAVAYLVGTIAELWDTVGTLTDLQVKWAVTYPFLFGGFCFVIGAYPGCVEATGSYILALLPPLGRKHILSAGRWIEYCNLLGSALFAGGGVVGLYESELTYKEWAMYTWIFYVVGSAVFLVQGALMYIETINPMV